MIANEIENFKYIYRPLCFFFCELSDSVFWIFFFTFICFSCWFTWVLYIFWTLIFCQWYVLLVSFPIFCLVFLISFFVWFKKIFFFCVVRTATMRATLLKCDVWNAIIVTRGMTLCSRAIEPNHLTLPSLDGISWWTNVVQIIRFFCDFIRVCVYFKIHLYSEVIQRVFKII